MKDGRFQNQDIGEFDNPSENDTGECNLERYHDLSYQVRDFIVETSFIRSTCKLDRATLKVN